MDIILGSVCAICIAAALWKPIFNDYEHFSECIGFWFTPDCWSFLNGQYAEDWLAELKLGLWIGLSSVGGYGVFWLVHELLG